MSLPGSALLESLLGKPTYHWNGCTDLSRRSLTSCSAVLAQATERACGRPMPAFGCSSTLPPAACSILESSCPFSSFGFVGRTSRPPRLRALASRPDTVRGKSFAFRCAGFTARPELSVLSTEGLRRPAWARRGQRQARAEEQPCSPPVLIPTARPRCPIDLSVLRSYHFREDWAGP